MKSKSLFHFKQFSVNDDACAMKVGTDAVLLGAWTNVLNAQTILDVGTGCGVIALMMAQRSSPTTKIDALEIERSEAEQAAKNVDTSPWSSKVKVIHEDIRNFDPDYRFDLIVSNPPYFIDSLKPPDRGRVQARHTETLTHDALIVVVKRLLKPAGRFHLILPFAEALAFIDKSNHSGLYCLRKCIFRGKASKPVERVMMEFGTTPGLCFDDVDVVLYDEGGQWTAAYASLTDEFYLDRNRSVHKET